MLVPNAERAVVDIRKLRDYCLDPTHDDGKHKARLIHEGHQVHEVFFVSFVSFVDRMDY